MNKHGSQTRSSPLAIRPGVFASADRETRIKHQSAVEGVKSYLKETQYLQCCAAIQPLQTQHPQDISPICVALARRLTVAFEHLSLQLLWLLLQRNPQEQKGGAAAACIRPSQHGLCRSDRGKGMHCGDVLLLPNTVLHR